MTQSPVGTPRINREAKTVLNAVKLTLIAPPREVHGLFTGQGIVSVKEATIVLLTPTLEDKIAAAVGRSLDRAPASKTSRQKPARG